MLHVQETTPSDPAVFGASAFSVLVFPDGWMYAIVHDAPGVVCIVALAVPPIAPPVTVRLDAPVVAVLDPPLLLSDLHGTMVATTTRTEKPTTPASNHPRRLIVFCTASSPSARN
jgi:hypothetical protein